MATVLGALTAVATIVGGIVYFFKRFSSTASERDQAIDNQIEKDKHESEDSGRPV